MPKKKKSDDYGTLLKHVRIPKDDEVSLEWFARQQNIHTSIRMLIHRQVAQYGSGDTFSALSEEMMDGWASAPKTETAVRRSVRAAAEPRARSPRKKADEPDSSSVTVPAAETFYEEPAVHTASESEAMPVLKRAAAVSENKADRSALNMPNPFKMQTDVSAASNADADPMDSILSVMDE